MKPLVSILIPAYNSEAWIAETLRSALAQTWERKEIIVVDDGSADRTASIARTFEGGNLNVVTVENGGAAAARNTAYSLAQGDYIQWLDADDLLAPDKISRQMEVLLESGSRMTLASSAFGRFMFRVDKARFVPTPLWEDLSPVEWMIRKIGQNLYMQTATWLTPRELAAAAGEWDPTLRVDDDGEYFCRVLMHSDGVRFVPGARVYYRDMGAGRLSVVGASPEKMEAQLKSIQLHIGYLRAMQDGERVRAACVQYAQNCAGLFYPERMDLIEVLREMASELGGRLADPQLRPRYVWIQRLFGASTGKWAQLLLPNLKSSVSRWWDKSRHLLRTDGGAVPR